MYTKKHNVNDLYYVNIVQQLKILILLYYITLQKTLLWILFAISMTL